MTVALLLLFSAAGSDPSASFLKTYCFSCHGEKAQMGNRRFDRAPLDLAAIGRRVESGTMPPKSAKQPAAAERQAFLAHVAKQAPGKIALRRLNRREYQNTIGDLLDMPMDQF